ncbi:hypothetical protein AVEN_172506-2 [Araneus ventricosus]|uniref:SRCR domain-containing protein n=1 Tax=Araneus ventricosus TaxID=182803 RepID=A0A4Y2DQE4_ARAVE|nr:hypothetical protein AVEN_172506-2 [Araneus ventricosus]
MDISTDFCFISIFLELSALATRSSADFNISCAMDDHENCARERGLHQWSNGVFTWNEEDLSVHCRDIMDNVDCEQEYHEKCGDETAVVFYKMATQDLWDLAQEMCNETSELRAGNKLS